MKTNFEGGIMKFKKIKSDKNKMLDLNKSMATFPSLGSRSTGTSRLDRSAEIARRKGTKHQNAKSKRDFCIH